MDKPRIKIYEYGGKRVRGLWMCYGKGKMAFGTSPKRAYDFWYYGLEGMIKRYKLL